MCPKLVRDGRADDLLDEPLRADGDGGEGHALDGQRGRRHGSYHRILLSDTNTMDIGQS